jgi:hypothetical protein
MLFIVAGVTWVFEVAEWAAENDANEDILWYWFIFDMVNILQAVAIFLIFVCNRAMIRCLQQECPNISSKFIKQVMPPPGIYFK